MPGTMLKALLTRLVAAVEIVIEIYTHLLVDVDSLNDEWTHLVAVVEELDNLLQKNSIVPQPRQQLVEVEIVRS